jgi:imidazolonepropionase-like amidohydrolase
MRGVLTPRSSLLVIAAVASTACGGEGSARGTTDAPTAAQRDHRPVAIVNGTIIDVVSGNRSKATVLAKEGTIAAIGGSDVVPQDAIRLDASGKFVVPGLWDMHAHVELTGSSTLDLLVANGVTGVRDMGSDPDYILPLRERIRRGETSGPEIVAAGPILDTLRPPGPLLSPAPPFLSMRRRVANADEARAAVAELHTRGVDLFKVHDTTPRDAFFAIAEESRKRGVPFAGHVPWNITIEEAAEAGIRSIEHLANFRVTSECSMSPPHQQIPCDTRFGNLAGRGVWQAPTIAFTQAIPALFRGEPMPHREYASDSLLEATRENARFSKFDEAKEAWFTNQARASLPALRLMVERGNSLLAACDGLVPGFCIHDELEWMTRAGLTPLQALQTATLNPARYLGRDHTLGTVAVGKRADLLVLDADPSLEIQNTRRIAAVVIRGRLLQRVDLDRLLAAQRR